MNIWNRAYIFGWVAWLLIFICYEFYAMIWGSGKDPMLTQVVVKYVPKWITLPFCGWLFLHFALRYFDKNYIKDLGTTHPYKGFI